MEGGLIKTYGVGEKVISLIQIYGMLHIKNLIMKHQKQLSMLQQEEMVLDIYGKVLMEAFLGKF